LRDCSRGGAAGNSSPLAEVVEVGTRPWTKRRRWERQGTFPLEESFSLCSCRWFGLQRKQGKKEKMEESNIKLLRSCHAWVMQAGHDLGSDLIAFRVRNFFQLQLFPWIRWLWHFKSWSERKKGDVQKNHSTRARRKRLKCAFPIPLQE